MPNPARTNGRLLRWFNTLAGSASIASLIIALGALHLPLPLHGLLSRRLIAVTLCPLTVMIFLVYVVPKLRNLGATLKTILFSLLLYFSSLLLAVTMGQYIPPLAGQNKESLTQPLYDGRLNLYTYCQERYGSTFILTSVETPECTDDTTRHPFKAEEACLWQFGSRDYRVEPQAVELICDTSKRTRPPCSTEQRYCGNNNDYCCPALE